MNRGKLCVLVPARNCARFLPELVSRTPLHRLNDEIIVIDDASDDGTLAVARSLPGVHAVRNETRRGYGATSRKLYDIALERGADFAVNIHGDLGHPPEAVAELLSVLEERTCDVVLGSRYLYLRQQARRAGPFALLDARTRRNMPLVRLLGHASITAVQNALYGTSYHSFHEGMRGASRDFMSWCVREPLTDWYDFDASLIVEAHRAGWRIDEIGIAPHYTPDAPSGVPVIRYGMRSIWRALCNSRFTAGPRRGPGP